jgi:hypothetical protein
MRNESQPDRQHLFSTGIFTFTKGPNRRTPKLRVTPGSSPRICYRYITDGVWPVATREFLRPAIWALICSYSTSLASALALYRSRSTTRCSSCTAAVRQAPPSVWSTRWAELSSNTWRSMSYRAIEMKLMYSSTIPPQVTYAGFLRGVIILERGYTYTQWPLGELRTNSGGSVLSHPYKSILID